MEKNTFFGVLHRFGYDISSQQIRQIQAYHRKLIPLNSFCVQTHQTKTCHLFEASP